MGLGAVVVWAGVGVGFGVLGGGATTGAAVVLFGVGVDAGAGAAWVAVARCVRDGEGDGEADADAEGEGEEEGDAEAPGDAEPPGAGAGVLAATGADRVKSVAKATVANALIWVMRQVSVDSLFRPSWRSAPAVSLCRMLLAPAWWSENAARRSAGPPGTGTPAGRVAGPGKIHRAHLPPQRRAG